MCLCLYAHSALARLLEALFCHLQAHQPRRCLLFLLSPSRHKPRVNRLGGSSGGGLNIQGVPRCPCTLPATPRACVRAASTSTQPSKRRFVGHIYIGCAFVRIFLSKINKPRMRFVSRDGDAKRKNKQETREACVCVCVLVWKSVEAADGEGI